MAILIFCSSLLFPPVLQNTGFVPSFSTSASSLGHKRPSPPSPSQMLTSASPLLLVKVIHHYKPFSCKLISSGKKYCSETPKGTQISELRIEDMLQLHMNCNLDVQMFQNLEWKTQRISKFLSEYVALLWCCSKSQAESPFNHWKGINQGYLPRDLSITTENLKGFRQTSISIFNMIFKKLKYFQLYI